MSDHGGGFVVELHSLQMLIVVERLKKGTTSVSASIDVGSAMAVIDRILGSVLTMAFSGGGNGGGGVMRRLRRGVG